MVKKLSIVVLLILGVFFFVLAFKPDNSSKNSLRISMTSPQPLSLEVWESPTPKIFDKKNLALPASNAIALGGQNLEPTPAFTPVPSSIPTLAPSFTISPSLSSPTPTPAPASLQVNLSINGVNAGAVVLNDGANQCDVLSKALEQGKISSLNMRYDNNLGTNAVYQINGIGKDNSVWWTYKVNGVAPTQGCSFVKVNNGDSVEWSYLGQ